VLWSFDSHHSFENERKFQKLFDTYFIAHSFYIDKFDDVAVEWLPCCYVRFGIDRLKELRLRSLIERGRRYDIVFPFKSYDIGNRNVIAQKLREYFHEQGLRFFFGPLDSGMPYTEMILKSQIVLNISLIDDLNIRNFEAWGLNRLLLTNKVYDHDKLKNADFSGTHFFERDLQGFGDVLNNALAQENTMDTAVDVLNHHMLIHRYVEMINKSLGTDYDVKTFFGE